MSFIKFSDEYGSVEGVLFPSAYSKIGDVSRNNIYKVNAKVERRENIYQLIIYDAPMAKKIYQFSICPQLGDVFH